MAEPRTLLAALIEKLRGCNVHGDAEESPVAVLWTDPKGEWKPLIPLLRQQLPELLCLGDYDPEHLQGPSLWLRCLVDRSLPAPDAAAGRLPVLYLPGVSRQELRAGEGCPWALEPLIEYNCKVTDIRQVKGLEFDYVILVDVTASQYPADDESRHLLHIGATRAAHQLWVVATGTASTLLPSYMFDE